MAAGGDLGAIAAQPWFPVEELPAFMSESEKTDDGTRQSYLAADNIQTGFRFEFRNQTLTQKQSFDTFWSDNQGSYHRFTWTDPRTSTVYNLCFPEGTTYEPRHETANTYSWTVDVEFVKP